MKRVLAAAWKRLGGYQLALACIAVMCGTLWAGLWPFHAPKNEVMWLPGGNGLGFGSAGTIVSQVEMQPPAPTAASGCSVEVWIQPALARLYSSATLLAFYEPQRPIAFGIRQERRGIRLERSGEFNGAHLQNWYISKVLRPNRSAFLTVGSGPRGTILYLDGIPLASSSEFRLTAGECGGRLVVGTSPSEHDGWSGQLRGLAVWNRELTAPEVLKHYEVWSKNGNAQTAAGEGCIGLYLFRDGAGTFARNQIAGGADLFIPPQYEIQDQAFLLPFWEEASTYWIHWKSVLENVLGLVPLGFLFYAWFQSSTSPRRAAWMATLTGTLVSVTIEVVQGFLPTRYSGTTDIFTNTLGASLGVLLYRWAARWLRPELANGTQNGEELRQHSNVGRA